MTITLHWWYLPIALFLLPFLWLLIRRPDDSGMWGDMYLDVMLVGMISWISAIVSLITYWIMSKP